MDSFSEDQVEMNMEIIDYNNTDCFDIIIGYLEDMLVDSKFADVLENFMEEHWIFFDNSEENKLIYTDIFMKYTQVIERFIENYLRRKLKEFCIESFLKELRRKKLEGEVYEILYSLSDFLAFKERILDYKSIKEGRTMDLSSGIKITRLL